MFETSIATVPAGRFFGTPLLTMRPYTPKNRDPSDSKSPHAFQKHNGAPLHFGKAQQRHWH